MEGERNRGRHGRKQMCMQKCMASLNQNSVELRQFEEWQRQVGESRVLPGKARRESSGYLLGQGWGSLGSPGARVSGKEGTSLAASLGWVALGIVVDHGVGQGVWLVVVVYFVVDQGVWLGVRPPMAVPDETSQGTANVHAGLD